MTTVADLIEAASREFQAAGLVFGHGTDNAWDEASALVLGVTGLPDDRANLVAVVDDSTVERIASLKDRRIRERIPLPYLLNVAKFAGAEFFVEPGVVIPRSPIAELIVRRFEPWLSRPPATLLDLCCGSGCIGIAAALRFPDCRVTLVDNEPTALALARRNVVLHHLQGRVTVIESDLFDALADGPPYDLILTNPPYVDRVDMSSLPTEFRHEPVAGLDGGPDGLEFVHRILTERFERSPPRGMLVCEVGMSAPALLRAYPKVPFIWPTFKDGGGVFILNAH